MSDDVVSCLLQKVRDGLLNAASAEKARRAYERIATEYAEKMTATFTASPGEMRVAERAAKLIEEAALRTAQQAQKHAERMLELEPRVTSHPGGVALGLMSILDRDATGRSNGPAVFYRAKAIEGQFHAMLDRMLDTLRPRWFGVKQDRITLRHVIAELYGEASGNPVAKEFAQQWKQVTDWSVDRFNQAGGDIKKRADWDVTHRHDRRAIAAVEPARWVEYVLPLLDRNAMRNEFTGLPMSEKELRLALASIHETLRTGGMNQLEPGFLGAGKLANKGQDPRSLVFKDSRSWLDYDQKYGSGGDVFATMTGILRARARDTALLEILGPNPDAAMKTLVDVAKKRRADQAKLSLDSVGIQWAENTYAQLTGRLDQAASPALAGFFGGARNLLTSAQLGQAIIAAATDLGFVKSTAGFNGLPVMKVIDQQIKLFNPRNAEHRRQSVRNGLIAEAWHTTLLGGSRWSDGIVAAGKGWTGWIADSVLRASGLTHWTEANRKAFGMAFLGHLADVSATPYAQLDEPLRKALASVGIGAKAWQRAPELVGDFGRPGEEAKFIDVLKGARGSSTALNKLAQRLHELVLRETDFAVPTPTVSTRAALLMGTQAGTGAGELMRSFAQYKSFSVAMMTSHMARHAYDIAAAPSSISPYWRAASTLIGLTVLGAAVVQFKQIAAGKDPRDMADSKFLGAAVTQGGGLGIIGDFLYSGLSRHGLSIAEWAAGPVAAAGGKVAALAFAPVRRMIEGTDTNVAAGLIRTLGEMTPGNNLWYAKLALERLVTNQLRLMADPRAFRAFRQMEKKARDDAGQAFWWRPGSTAPDRAPDLTAVVGGSR